MLRHLVHNFQRLLTIRTPAPIFANQKLNNFIQTQQQRLIFQQTITNLDATKEYATPHEGNDDAADIAPTIDSEYIVPYRTEHEKFTPAYAIVETLRTRFRITAAEEKRILTADIVSRARYQTCLPSLDLLCHSGVTKRSCIDYPWLLTQDKIRLQTKLDLINTMQVRDINHFVAFLRLTVPRLKKLIFMLNNEAATVPLGNRIYYISEKIKTDPYVVSKYLSKRLFILEMPYEMLETNLKHMIDYKVPPLSILKDLWAFRYTPKSVKLRFERAKRANKDKIMPWMVRCPEPILQRSLKLSLDELTVLGDKSNLTEYIADRLGFSLDETRAIMAKHPAVNRVRVTKVKEVLDYLLNEAGFTRHEIAQVPRILCHGLETTKQRYEELKSHGCRPSSLVILCRSKREYAKFVQSWLQMAEDYNRAKGRTTNNSTTQAEH